MGILYWFVALMLISNNANTKANLTKFENK